MGACLLFRQNRNRFLDQKAWQLVVWLGLVLLVLGRGFLNQEMKLLMMPVAEEVAVMVMAAWWVVLLFLQFSPVPWPVFVRLFVGVEMVILF